MNAFDRRGFAVERTGDLAACRVTVRVQDAVAGVGAFTGEEEAGAVFVELGAPVDEFLNGGWPFLHESVDGWDITKAVAGIERVVFVKGDLVVVGERHRDATLGVFGSGFFEAVFGDDEHCACLGEFDGGPETGNARADDEKIRGDRIQLVSYGSRKDMSLVKLLDAERLPEGAVCEVLVDGVVLALCHASDGFYAVTGECPHVGGPLGQGALHGHALVCPWHAWEFDCVTGQCDFRDLKLQRFPVVLLDGEVMVDLNA